MAYQPKSYKKFVATAATATLVATAVAPTALAADFTDVNANYKNAVDYLVDQGITKGLTETTFGVTSPIKRGDAAIMIAKALGLNTTTAPDAGFTDVNARVAGAVNAIVAAGIASGKTSTTFAPDLYITRQETAKIIANAYGLTGSGTTKFADVNSNWAPFVSALEQAGIAQGLNETTFGATNDVTRGQFALFLYRAEGQPYEVAAVESLTFNAEGNQFVLKFAEALPEGADLNYVLENYEILLNGVAPTAAQLEALKLSATVSADRTTVTVSHTDLDELASTLGGTSATLSVGGKSATYTFDLEPKVNSVTPLSATQVEVKFNVAVDADDAETVARYTINNISPASVSLGADEKTATLTFANPSEVEVSNGVVVVNPVITAANEEVKTEKYTQILSYEDTVKPVIASVSSKTNGTSATSLTVTASEPIVSSLAKVNGTYYTVTFSGKTGTINGLNLAANQAHTLELINLTDKGGNVTVSTSQSFSVTVDTAVPTAALTSQSDKGILVTFNKKMDEATVVAALSTNAVKDELLQNVAYTAPTQAVAGSNGTQYLIQVTDTLFANKNSRNLSVVLPGTMKDSLGNAFVAGTQAVTLTKDTVSPVSTGYKVVKNANGEVTDIEIHFSEGLAANLNPAEPTIVDMNGVAVSAASFLGGLTADAITAGDKKVTYSVATPAKLTGKYAFSFGSNLVTDRSESANTSAAFNYTVDFGNGATTFSLPSTNLPSATANVVTVEFGKAVKGGAVANSATDVANYSLGGKPLPAGTTITLDAPQDTATITLPTNTISTTDAASVFTVANVMALDGSLLTSYTGTVSVDDNVQPLLSSASLTADNKLAIGFNETLATAPIASDLVFKVNGSTVTQTGTTALTVSPGTGSDAGKYLVNLGALVIQGSPTGAGLDGTLGTADDVAATPTFFDVNNNGTFDAGTDVKIADGPVANFTFTSSPAITGVTVTTLATGATTAKDAKNNTLKNGVTVTAK